MKFGFSFRLLSCVAALALLLLSLPVVPAACDDSCRDEAPTCECACLCCCKALAEPIEPPLPAVMPAIPALRFQAIQHSFALATDIFRPPIA